MPWLISLLVGAITGAAAVLLHLALSPVGLIISVLGTFTSTWALGRVFGSRKYKAMAGVSWSLVFWQGAKFGVGNEILIQGDNLGTGLLFFGAIAIISAITLPAR